MISTLSEKKEKTLFRRLCEADTYRRLWTAVDCAIDQSLHSSKGQSPKSILDSAESIVLYGAGLFGRSVIAAWKKAGIVPNYCVDSNPEKWGKFLDNVPVHGQEVLFRDVKRPVVVIAAMTTHEIEDLLDAQGIPYLYAERDGTVGFLPGHWLSEHREEFEEVHSLLDDTLSRHVLLEIAKARMFQRYYFPMRGNFFAAGVATFPQYFEPALVKLTDEELFIDCGAFDGDTLVDFASRMWRIGSDKWKAVAFEADSENMRLLDATLRRFSIGSVRVVNAAVGRLDKTADASEFYNCRDSQGSEAVSVVTLDSALADLAPTFIKIDIEGGELDALAGGRDTIVRAQPKLATCAYHQSSHLLEIPLLLAREHPGYKIFLRHHSSGTLWETVCYAIPS